MCVLKTGLRLPWLHVAAAMCVASAQDRHRPAKTQRSTSMAMTAKTKLCAGWSIFWWRRQRSACAVCQSVTFNSCDCHCHLPLCRTVSAIECPCPHPSWSYFRALSLICFLIACRGALRTPRDIYDRTRAINMFQVNARNRCDVSTQSTHLGPLVLLLSNQAFVPTHTHVSNIQLNIPPPHVMPPLHAHAHTFNRVLRCCIGSCYERVRAHVSASRVYAGDTAAFVDACAEPYLTAAVGGSRTSQALELNRP